MSASIAKQKVQKSTVEEYHVTRSSTLFDVYCKEKTIYFAFSSVVKSDDFFCFIMSLPPPLFWRHTDVVYVQHILGPDVSFVVNNSLTDCVYIIYLKHLIEYCIVVSQKWEIVRKLDIWYSNLVIWSVVIHFSKRIANKQSQNKEKNKSKTKSFFLTN